MSRTFTALTGSEITLVQGNKEYPASGVSFGSHGGLVAFLFGAPPLDISQCFGLRITAPDGEVIEFEDLPIHYFGEYGAVQWLT